MIPEGITYEYSKIRFLLIKVIEENSQDPKKIQFIKGKTGSDRETYIEIEDLEPGLFY